MRLKSFLFLILIFIISGYLKKIQAQDLKTSVGYMSYIGEEYNKITKDQWDYTRSVAHGKSARKVEKRRKELLNTIKETKYKISKMPAFEGDKTLKDSVGSFLAISYNVINEDYAKLVDMDEVKEQSFDAMEAYLIAKELADEKLTDAAIRMSTAQEAFAAKNNIKLIESETKLGEKMRKASEVFSYYNDLYLLFFKSYHQDNYLMEALSAKDISGIEQNKSALISYSDEGLEKLKEFGAFKGNYEMANMTKKALNFYKEEAEVTVPAIVECILAQEKFEKIKTSFDAIKPNKRTQADVDQYNNGIKEVNEAIARYNEVNAKLFDKKNDMIKEYNKVSDSFLNKNVP